MRRLNPAWKLLTLMVASLILSVTLHTRLNLLTAGACLAVTVFTPGVQRKRLALALVPFLLAAAGMFMAGFWFSSGGGDALLAPAATNQGAITVVGLRSGLQLASRVLAYGGLGMLFAFTTTALELVLSLHQQFRLPAKFAYGILAAYHFFPVVQEEYRIVGAALKVRGIKASPLSRRRIFPMLVHALQRSESLAMAMESRGFEDGASRGEAIHVPAGVGDLVLFLGVNGLLILGLWLL